MSTKKYINDFNNEISLQQAMELDTYSEIINDNNQKLMNTYSKGELINTCYYISSDNDIGEILTSNPNASFQIQSIVNNYSIYNLLYYKNNELKHKTQIIKDSFGNPICYQEYDSVTGTPQYLTTEKSYYDENETEIYSFSYNADGSCFSINRVQLIEPGSEFMAKDIGTDPDIDFTWQGFEYYQNAEPLVPTN